MLLDHIQQSFALQFEKHCKTFCTNVTKWYPARECDPWLFDAKTVYDVQWVLTTELYADISL